MTLAETGMRGHGVELQPLNESHVPSLVDAAGDGNLWKLFFTSVPTPDTMGGTVRRFIAEQSAGTGCRLEARRWCIIVESRRGSEEATWPWI